jgi:hypothetical protein
MTGAPRQKRVREKKSLAKKKHVELVREQEPELALATH